MLKPIPCVFRAITALILIMGCAQASQIKSSIINVKAYSTNLEFADNVAGFAAAQSKQEKMAIQALLKFIWQNEEVEADELLLLQQLLALPDDQWLAFYYQSTLYAEVDPVSENGKRLLQDFLDEKLN